MADDDIFDQVQAPCWAENLQFENDNYDDLDDNFFPVDHEIEKITLEVEDLRFGPKEPEENPEDLSRMAMFGHKTQVKRRSQIRKEQEMKKTSPPPVVTAPPPRTSSIPRPASRSSSIPRAPSLTRTTTTAPAPRPTGPVTRSQTRALTGTPTSHPQERRGRDMTRNATAAQRRHEGSPAPNQLDFALALTQRPGSLGQGNRRTGFGTSTPVPIKTTAPLNIAVTRAPGVPSHRVAPRNPSATRNATTAPAAAPKPNPLARARAPITVTKSPGAHNFAFGSAVKPKPQVPRTSAIRSRQETQQTPSTRVATRAAPLRVYPTPSGQTPVRNLTLPKTPVVAKRTSSITRSGPQTPVAPSTAERRVLKPRDIQGMVDRLSKPKNVTSIQRPATAGTPRRTIPNTYTHGMTAGVKVRSRSNSRPTSQTNSRSASCTRDENIQPVSNN